jgi:hypothetical protein
MTFIIPLLAAKAITATITVGQAVGIGTMALGIGAGIKGFSDYQKAKKILAEAETEYQQMAQKIKKRAFALKKSSNRLAA